MAEKLSVQAERVLIERFGQDCLLSVATIDEQGRPCVRTVNAHYEDRAFYVITHARSGKMRQLANNPQAAVCGDWFTAHGVGENLGHVLLPCHAALMNRLRTAFASWYSNGHVNEQDENTCILRICLTDGILFDHGTRYDIDFTR